MRNRFDRVSTVSSSASYTGSGRLPTIDMSPFSTLISCGSSSMLVLRINLPTRVIRGSLAILQGGFLLRDLLLLVVVPVVADAVLVHIHQRRTGLPSGSWLQRGRGHIETDFSLATVLLYWFSFWRVFQFFVGAGAHGTRVCRNQTLSGQRVWTCSIPSL